MNTKDQIIEAAEILFAERGYDGTSLRDITEAARANVASVNYHFGSKENLLRVVLDRVIVPINSERIERLDGLEALGRPDIGEILGAFLFPDLKVLEELAERHPALPRFVARMYSEGSPLMQELMVEQFAEIGERFGTAFGAALPHLDAVEIMWRLRCVVGIVVYMFAGVTAPGMPTLASGDAELDLDRLLSVTVPLMTAPAQEVVAS